MKSRVIRGKEADLLSQRYEQQVCQMLNGSGTGGILKFANSTQSEGEN